MDLSKIITVAGRSGLYRILAQGRQALIVESLADGKRLPVHSSVRVSSLEEISMFTTGDDVPLTEVLGKLFEQEGGKLGFDLRKADDEALYAKLGEVLPDHDRERIYASDLRKLFGWYELLVKSGALAEAKAAEKEAEQAKEEVSKEEKKPAKKAAAKKPDGEKATKAKSAAKSAGKGAPKPGGASKAKTTTVRKGSQRGG
ncbi:MAG TPA: DUF5606 domain-containing protein [Flavobacteriales bacterium]|nr:DUF5606 domain-containing protein [Flavobacteriales bacterium]HPQ57210.1 DUF5606 domain-containing protein [Flavobacteriales bacterium]HRW88321.1 DUF5606 domain-containing protein [Flavobacteriales bacterium]